MYKCVIYDEQNKRKTIHLDVDTEEEVWKYANENKVKVAETKERKFIFRSNKLKDKELKIFSKEMSILLKSGCEISKILNILTNQSNDKLKGVLKIISKKIEKGNSITEAFESTNAFSKFYISMIKAGEISGSLDEVMDRLATYYEKESKLKSRITSILIYPIILLVCLFFSFLFILVFLVPTFEDIYADGGMSIPIITKILIFLSHILRDHLILITSINTSLIFGFIYLKNNNKKVKELLNKWKFTIPVIKTYSQLKITNKFSKSLSILIWSGVQIVESIDISAKVVNNDLIYKKICVANDSIKRGNSIGESLKLIDEFPKLFLSMIIIGEESGRLDDILSTITDYYDNELDSKLEIGTKYFENIVTIVIGLVVAFTIISMVIPMIDAVASV
ncbi:MAG: type II secretion system F family protein [Terrisporobacter sp.]|uniref:type II secretion system F family protein n=1 Tax=Terrisporobacter sp. TaxID=1965305 RepID=UPI002FC82067